MLHSAAKIGADERQDLLYRPGSTVRTLHDMFERYEAMAMLSSSKGFHVSPIFLSVF